MVMWRVVYGILFSTTLEIWWINIMDISVYQLLLNINLMVMWRCNLYQPQSPTSTRVFWLVVSQTPLKNMKVGIITFPTEWNKHVPNQSVFVCKPRVTSHQAGLTRQALLAQSQKDTSWGNALEKRWFPSGKRSHNYGKSPSLGKLRSFRLGHLQ